MDANSKNEPFDSVTSVKYSILSGSIAAGAVWIYSQVSPGVVNTVKSVTDEVFTGVPNF